MLYLTILTFLGLKFNGLRSSWSKSLKCTMLDLRWPLSPSIGLDGLITTRLSLRFDLYYFIRSALSLSYSSSSKYIYVLLSLLLVFAIASFTLSYKASFISMFVSSSVFILVKKLNRIRLLYFYSKSTWLLRPVSVLGTALNLISLRIDSWRS